MEGAGEKSFQITKLIDSLFVGNTDGDPRAERLA